MRVLCYGSLNLDHIYNVQAFVRPGETCKALSVEQHCGGKGFNQAVAAAKAGLPVSLAGCIGADGGVFVEKCAEVGIDTTDLCRLDLPTGNAVIQVNERGENCILLYGGANQAVTRRQIDRVLSGCQADDVLLLQNEISELPYLVDRAAELGLRIAMNPSPMNETITQEMLEKAAWLFVNEVEAEQLCGCTEAEDCLERLSRMCPNGGVVLTLGGAGSCYRGPEGIFRQTAFAVQTVDTTAAGDTFTGYFMEAILRTGDPGQALRLASKAAALAVTRKGAFESIPYRDEVLSSKLDGADMR